MIPNTTAIARDKVYYVAVDIDLVALDTLTPWLAHYGLTVDDVKPTEGKIWTDIVSVIEEKAEPSSVYERPYDYWCDGSIYENAHPHRDFMKFLGFMNNHIRATTKKEVRFFFCSTCVSSHKPEKLHRVKQVYGDVVQGFVDTSCKHLVDFDLLLDDSPDQCVNAAIAGKRAMLCPSPANNLEELSRVAEVYGVRDKIYMLDGEYGECFTDVCGASVFERIETLTQITGV